MVAFVLEGTDQSDRRPRRFTFSNPPLRHPQEKRTLLPPLAAGKLDLPARLRKGEQGQNAVELPKFEPLIAEWRPASPGSAT